MATHATLERLLLRRASSSSSPFALPPQQRQPPRPLLALPPRHHHHRTLSTTTTTTTPPPRRTPRPKPPRTKLIPPTSPTSYTPAETLLSTISYLPPPSNDPSPSHRALPAPIPNSTALAKATALFTTRCPRFLYSASRFHAVPRNPHTPEVCLLGRSNVGKSTLVNALAGVGAHAARRAHGRGARAKGLALTSKTAGSTKAINAYGFGEAGRGEREAWVAAREKEAERGREENGVGAGSAQGGSGSGGRTRSERRALAASERRDRPPEHKLVMVDMPGYGLGSEAEWGVEIAKYLDRRKMLRGAVLLVDAVSGIKQSDRMVLGLLRDADVRTMVVLTKVDKLREEPRPGRATRRVEDVCVGLWEELREADKNSLTWVEGAEKGWQPEIFVTSAGDPGNDGQGVGVVGVRWAICKMAGLVEDDRVMLPAAQSPPSAQKIVSFDQIQWASPATETKAGGEQESA